MKHSNITAIILAGGKSSRMGKDKAFVAFSGRPLIEILIDKISSVFGDLIIVTNKPALYRKYGLRIEVDITKDKGPLAGIYTGLISSEDNYNFIFACDMPFLSRDLIRYMAGERDGYDAVIPEYNGRLEPLCAVYSKSCIRPIETELSRNNLKISDFTKYINARIIRGDEISKFGSDRILFANINTPEDMNNLTRL